MCCYIVEKYVLFIPWKHIIAFQWLISAFYMYTVRIVIMKHTYVS